MTKEHEKGIAAPIKIPRVLWFKGLLFVVAGCLALGLVWAECFTWRVLAFSLLACWCFSRAYYFAFYVIEHYIDPSFRFAGLWSVWTYWRRYGLRPFDNATSKDEVKVNNMERQE